jgi:hypothetical protein
MYLVRKDWGLSSVVPGLTPLHALNLAHTAGPARRSLCCSLG